LTRKKRSKKSSGGGRDRFDEFIGLALFMLSFMAIMFIGEPTIMSERLFAIIMTLGGLETYDQTVIGITIGMLLLGTIAITWT